MTQPSHGIREGSKADRPQEEKEKERDKEEANAEEEEDSSDQEGKGPGKGRRKGRSHMVSNEGYEEDWNENGMRHGMMATGPLSYLLHA